MRRARLTAVDLDVVRGERVLVRGVSFDVGPGDALVLRGANGVGKSSLLAMIAGFIDAPGRALSLTDAADATDLAPSEAVAFASHRDGVRSDETVGGHLRFQARWLSGDTQRLEEAVRRFSLSPLLRRPARRLSAGQRRRVALARTWASGRPLWLLDEPAAPLDEEGRAALALAVADHRAAGGCVIAAAHDAPPWPGASSLTLERPASERPG